MIESAARTVGCCLFVVGSMLATLTTATSASSEPPAGAPSAPSDQGAVGDDQLSIETHVVTPPVSNGRASSISLGVDLPNGPEMLAIDTAGRPGGFALRTQSADGTWSEWLQVVAEPEEAPDGGAGEEGSATSVGAIGPIWVGDDAIRVEMVQTDGEPGTVELLAINSTDTSAPITPDLTRANSVVGASTAAPAIVPRSAWATRGWRSENSGCEGGPFIAPNVRTVVVHHTVTNNTYAPDQVDDILRAIYRLHADTNGWCDIAYNFVVDRFGTIWEARSGGTDQPVIGGHAKGFNTWTVGVALLGQHQSGASPAAAAPSAEAMAAVQAIAAWKLSLHGIDPLGSSWLKNRSSRPPHRHPPGEFVSLPTIVGHRDLGVTSCPGSLTVPSIAPMRASLAVGHNASPPPIPLGRTPEPGPKLIVSDVAGGLRAAAAGAWTSSPTIGAGRSVIAAAGRNDRGQLLLDDGTLVAFGGASAVAGRPAGSRTVVDLATGTDGGRGWILDDNGALVAFGGAPSRAIDSSPPARSAVAMDLTSNGRGYVLDRSGRLHPVNGAPSQTIERPLAAGAVAVDIGLRSNGTSGWIVDSSGVVTAFGDAGPAATETPVANVRAIAVGGDFGGWVLDAEGRLVRFGDERRANPISTTVGQADIVDVALVGWDYGTENDDTTLAAAWLELFLRQTPSPALADHYGFKIDEFSRREVVDELSQSEEWAGRLIDELYGDVLGRRPDADGKQYWLDQLRGGLRTQELGALFYGSTEYVASSGSTESYVRRLYRELLDREPDGPGLAFWVEQINSGRLSAPEVTIGFYQSPESRRGRVSALYAAILDRAPDPGGADFWTEQLLVFDDIALAQELAISEEFRARALS